jgi:hypothetical protein
MKLVFQLESSMNKSLFFVACTLFFTLLVKAQTATSPGTLTTYSNIYSIGMEWKLTGDTDHDAKCQVQYRQKGQTTYLQAAPLFRVHHKNADGENYNLFSGSIMFLNPGTVYEVRLSITDPDGGTATRDFTISTRPLPTLPTGGRFFHVVPGDGGGSGTVSNPFKGPEYAFRAAQPGDTFLFHKGTYSPFRISKSGSAGKYIVLRPAGDGLVTLRQLTIDGSYLWVEGFTFTKSTESTALRSVNNGRSNNVISRNKFSGFSYTIALSGGSSGSHNWYIADNDITGTNTDPNADNWSAGEGIEMQFTSGHTICHNRITKVADGMSYPVKNVDIFGNDIFDLTDDGIELDGAAGNVRVWGNRLYNCFQHNFSFQNMRVPPVYFVRNQVVSDSPASGIFKFRVQDQILFANNTILQRGRNQYTAQAFLRFYARNNLWLLPPGLNKSIWEATNPSSTTISQGGAMPDMVNAKADWRTNSDYNGFDWNTTKYPFMWFGDRLANLTELHARARIEKNSVRVSRDQLFGTISFSTNLYLRLKSGSSAIDAGVTIPNIVESFQGKAPDLGALEFGAPLPIYGPRSVNPQPPIPPEILMVSPKANSKLAVGGTLEVSAEATDVDAFISKVEFFAGSTLLGTDTSYPYTLNWKPTVGTYSFTAKAYDTQGLSKTSPPVTLTVTSGNQPPAVSIISPIHESAMKTGTNVVITASATDADGSVSRVQFYQGTNHLGTASSIPYHVTWPNVPEGVYDLLAIAVDNLGLARTSSVNSVSVITPNVMPSVSIRSPADGDIIGTGNTLIITANASDRDGTVTKVQFYANGTYIGSDTTAPYSIHWNYVPAGKHELTAKANDDEGGRKTSNPVTITVKSINNPPPVVTITSPAPDSSYLSPANFTVRATATDNSGIITRVEFYRGNTLLGFDTTSPYSLSVTNVLAGKHSLTARAYDNFSGSSTSSVVSVTVTNRANSTPSVTLTSPTAGSAFLAPANFNMTATATDSDGTISKVDFYVGGTLVGTDTDFPYSTSVSNIAAGKYSLTARATDDKNGKSTSSIVSITVTNAVNSKPVVSLTNPAAGSTFTSPATIELSATASDTDGSVTKVEFFNGSTLIGSETTSPYSITWNNVPAGTYSLTAKATDNKNATTTSASRSIKVNSPPNKAPTVAITNPANGATFMTPANVTINATAADTDGSISKVEFYNGTTLIDTDTTAPYSASLSNLPVGTYSLAAKAFDNSGASTTLAAVNITVNNALPTISLTAPLNGATLTAPAIIGLAATATDANGTITKVEFFNGTTLVKSDTTTPYTASVIGLSAGTYTFTARATDNDGGVIISQTANVTVNPAPNIPPTVSITNPADGAVFTAPANVAINATAADTDGSISKVEFYNGTTLIDTDTTAPYSASLSNLAVGTYSLTARAFDNSGASTTSAAISITVNNALPTVSLTAPVNGSTFTAAATINLAATASDSNGTITKVEFFNGSTLIRTDPGAPYTASVTGLTAGTYSFTARATDNDGAVVTSTASTLTVNPAPNVSPAVSITSPVKGAVFIAPANATIDATAFDSDGTISKVEFYNGTTLIGTDTSSPYSTPLSNLPVGTYSLTANAFDNSGASTTSAEVNITVTNALPVVALTAPTAGSSFKAPATINLAATATDSNGTIAKVEFFNGSTLIRSDPGAPYTASVTGLTAGTYSFTARATDNDGAVVTSAVSTVTVNAPVNGAPFASITTPTHGAVFTAPANLIVEATATDGDGPISKVEFYNGTTLISTDTSSPYSASLTSLPVGTYSLTAKAFDNSGASTTSAEVSITVTNALPAVALTAPTAGSSFTAPATINLAATASDANGTITKVEFFNGSTLIRSDPGAPYTASVTGLAAGTYSFTARATDNDGALVTSSPSTVTVNPAPNVSPAVSIITPTHGAIFTAPANLIVEATATDGDGSISKVEFYNGTTLIGTDTSSPYSTSLSNLPVGTYSFTARAFDNSGASTTSSEVSITVTNALPVVALTAPTAGSSFIAPATINLAATASDANGTITKVEFFNGSTLIRSDPGAPYTASVTGLTAGTYSFTARATDNDGAVVTSTASTLTVNPAPNVSPAVSITSPANGAVLTAPANVSITATASDSDGTISKVEFYSNGTLVHTDSQAPYEFTMNQVETGAYEIMAKAHDNQNSTRDSAAVIVTVANKVALLVSPLPLNAADLAVKTRLENLGFGVMSISDSQVETADAVGKSLVVITSNSAASEIGTLLRDAAVPILCWEPYLFDELALTGPTAEADYGRASGVRTLVMAGSSHPISAGLLGVRMVYTASGNMSWGRPSPAATKIAVMSDDSTMHAIFCYETGATMSGLAAPARRVGFCLGAGSAAFLSSEGWLLFDAAVKWSSGIIQQ